MQGDLLTAEIIVAVGRGVKDLEGFALMVRFAEAVHAQVAGTRGAVAEGWLSMERELGLSGKRVSPRLYIGCGVAGANFHTVGMKDSQTIIGINTDRRARIFELADYAIVDDVKTCITGILRGLPADPSMGQLIGLFAEYPGVPIGESPV